MLLLLQSGYARRAGPALVVIDDAEDDELLCFLALMSAGRLFQQPDEDSAPNASQADDGSGAAR